MFVVVLVTALGTAGGTIAVNMWTERSDRARAGTQWPLQDSQTCAPKGETYDRLLFLHGGPFHCREWTAQAPRGLHSAELRAQVTDSAVTLIRVHARQVDLKGAAPAFVDEPGPQKSLSVHWCDAREDASVVFEVWFKTTQAVDRPIVATMHERPQGTSRCDVR